MNKFPRATPQQIRLALLLTARVPHGNFGLKINPLRVKSGGVADADSAATLLSALSQWPADSNYLSDEWQTLLVSAKSARNHDLYEYQAKNFVKQEAKFLMRNEGEE